jgi:hypothetical protein
MDYELMGDRFFRGNITNCLKEQQLENASLISLVYVSFLFWRLLRLQVAV